jgi:hypothetical protein
VVTPLRLRENSKLLDIATGSRAYGTVHTNIIDRYRSSNTVNLGEIFKWLIFD